MDYTCSLGRLVSKANNTSHHTRDSVAFSRGAERVPKPTRPNSLQMFVDCAGYPITSITEHTFDVSNNAVGSSQTTSSDRSDHVRSYGAPDDTNTEFVGRLAVEIDRPAGRDLGFTFKGGKETDVRPFIDAIVPNGIIDRLDAILPHDTIIAINDKTTCTLSHREIAEQIKSTTKSVVLELQYRLPDYPFQPNNLYETRTVEVLLEKRPGEQYGITVRGGYSEDARKSRPHTIARVRKGSSGARCGQIQVGDILLAINDETLEYKTCEMVLQRLQSNERIARIFIQYVGKVKDGQRRMPSGLMQVEFPSTPQEETGISLAVAKSGVIVRDVKPGTLIDRDDLLRAGDQIEEINGVNLKHKNEFEARQLLNFNSFPGVTRLQVQPRIDICIPETNRYNTMPCIDRNTPASLHDAACDPWQTARSSSPAVSASPPRRHPADGPHAGGGRDRDNCSCYSTPPRERSRLANVTTATQQQPKSLQGFVSTPMHTCRWRHGTFSHVRVELEVGDRGCYGFTLRGSCDDPTDVLLEPPLIEYLDPDGPAARCNQLEENDLLVEVNGDVTTGRSMDDINSQIISSHPSCTLSVEIFLCDSVVPNSGIFTVKLSCTDRETGLTLEKADSASSSLFPLISGVQWGSPAHRCGSIHVGDRLLAINGASTRLTKMDDILRALHDSRQDTLHLEIETSSLASLIEVAVPDVRQPFGIEVNTPPAAAAADSGPIVVTAIDAEALRRAAVDCGSLLPGDRLVAIDGRPVANMTVWDVRRRISAEKRGSGSGGAVLKFHSKLLAAEEMARQRQKHPVADAQIPASNCSFSSPSSTNNSEFSGTHVEAFADVTHHPRTDGGDVRRAPKLKNQIPQIPSKDSAVDVEQGTAESESDTQQPQLQRHDCNNAKSVRKKRLKSQGNRPQCSVEEVDREYAEKISQFGNCKGCRTAVREEWLRAKEAAEDCTAFSGSSSPVSRRAAIDKLANMAIDKLAMCGDHVASMRRGGGGGGDRGTVAATAVYAHDDIVGASSAQTYRSAEHHQRAGSFRNPQRIRITVVKEAHQSGFGIGVSGPANQHCGAYVSEVCKDSPASQADIRVKDKILEVNGDSTKDMSYEVVTRLLKHSGNRVDLCLGRKPKAFRSVDNESASSVDEFRRHGIAKNTFV